MLRLVAITSRPGEAGCSHPVNAREELRGDATESSLGGWLTASFVPVCARVVVHPSPLNGSFVCVCWTFSVIWKDPIFGKSPFLQ